MRDAAYEIEKLLKFTVAKNMISVWDIIPCRNALMDILQIEIPYVGEVDENILDTPVEILNNILDYAYEIGIIKENTITERDLLDARLMGVLMPRQFEVNRAFFEKMEIGEVEEATSEFYELCKASNYIMTGRIAKNQDWLASTAYGKLEITINLSKPEKDPKEIAEAKKIKQTSYPKCLLCVDNIGYAGRANHPARQNLRVIPVKLCGEQWFFQYSPYLYYDEHCIVFKNEHVPMKFTENTLKRLLDFIDLFPHYFIGSNADLPIVGGSILTHDHYQGGRHEFPIERAEIEKSFINHRFDGVQIGIVNWPMSVIRLNSSNRENLIEAAMHIYHSWQRYSDIENDIIAYSNETPHNTITPIARKKNGVYEMDIVLRNNRTSVEYPDGIFHPHPELHHIKKENIGLIEVMGLAILPGRLESELKKIEQILTGEIKYTEEEIKSDIDICKHAEWIISLLEKYTLPLSNTEAEVLLKTEIGEIFAKVLEDAGVFKRTEIGKTAFESFLASIDIK